uniref:Uncharacterized protein n=1 Tax=Arundo donax TaxID=35708 RepID=A0A0A8ZZJ8_ARUDO
MTEALGSIRCWLRALLTRFARGRCCRCCKLTPFSCLLCFQIACSESGLNSEAAATPAARFS